MNQQIDYEVWVGPNEDSLEFFAGANSLREALRYAAQTEPGETVIVYRVVREVLTGLSGYL